MEKVTDKGQNRKKRWKQTDRLTILRDRTAEATGEATNHLQNREKETEMNSQQRQRTCKDR